MTPSELARLERFERVCDLRRKGWRIVDIARELKISPATASQDLREYESELKKLSMDSLTEIRDRDLERLDDLYKDMSKLVALGDTQATEKCLKILERRAKYLGLDAPDKVELRKLVPEAKIDLSRLSNEELQQYHDLYSKIVIRVGGPSSEGD